MIIKISNELINEAVNHYNKYRSPEVIASLVRIDGHYFTVKFEGSICFTCGFYDYFDDLIYILVDYGVLCKIVEVLTVDEGAVVRYEVIGLKNLA